MKFVHIAFCALISSSMIFQFPFSGKIRQASSQTVFSVPELESPSTTFRKVNDLSLQGMKKGKSFSGKNDLFLILIRDLHCQKEAQLRIAKAIRQLRQKAGISFVFLEGAEGKLRTLLFESFPDKKIRRHIGKKFLEEGYLTGAEFAAIEMGLDGNLKLFGAETTDLYLQNLKAFRKTRNAFSNMQEMIDDMDNWITQAKEILFSKELKTLDNIRSMLDGEGMDLERALSDLASLLGWKNSDSTSSPQESVLIDAQEMYKLGTELDQQEVEKELSNLIFLLEKNLVAEDLKEMAKKAIQFRLGQIRASEYLAALKDLYWENDIGSFPFEKEYPNLEKWVALTNKQEKLDINAVWQQLENVVEKTRKQLAVEENVTSLLVIDNRWRLIKKLIQLQLTRKDLKKIKLDGAVGKVDEIFKKMKALKRKSENLPDAPQGASSFTSLAETATSFYELAQKRDAVLVEKTLSQLKLEKTNGGILVTGGFHTEGIQTRLEGEGISYVTWTPTVTSEVDGTRYEEIMMDESYDLDEIEFSDKRIAWRNESLEVKKMLSVPAMTGRIMNRLSPKGKEIFGELVQSMVEAKISEGTPVNTVINDWMEQKGPSDEVVRETEWDDILVLLKAISGFSGIFINFMALENQPISKMQKSLAIKTVEEAFGKDSGLAQLTRRFCEETATDEGKNLQSPASDTTGQGAVTETVTDPTAFSAEELQMILDVAELHLGSIEKLQDPEKAESGIRPRIEIRKDLLKNVVQVALCSQSKAINNKIAASLSELFGKNPDNRLSFNQAGLGTIEIGIKGIDFRSARQFVKNNFDQILQQMHYKHKEGQLIDAKTTKTIVFAEADGAIYNRPVPGRAPIENNLENSAARDSLVQYLEAGGIVAVTAGNDLFRTAKRIFKGIPKEKRHLLTNILIIADGGGVISTISPTGSLNQVALYRRTALLTENQNVSSEHFDDIYIGQEYLPPENSLSVSLLPPSPHDVDRHLGNHDAGARTFFEAAINQARKTPLMPLFLNQQVNNLVATARNLQAKRPKETDNAEKGPILISPQTAQIILETAEKIIRLRTDIPNEVDLQSKERAEKGKRPRIEVRTFQDDIIQITIGAENKVLRDIMQKLLSTLPESEVGRLFIVSAGSASVEISIDGVDKGLPIGFLENHFDEILDEIGYVHREEEPIDARKTRTVIIADGDGTTYDKPILGKSPTEFTLENSEARNNLIEYLESGGIYAFNSGNDAQRTAQRILAGIPPNKRTLLLSRIIVIAAGGGIMARIDPETGALREIANYRKNALDEKSKGPAQNLDIIYVGDDYKATGNDSAAFLKVGLTSDSSGSAILVSDRTPEYAVLSSNQIGGFVKGTSSLLKAVTEHARANPGQPIFTQETIPAIIDHSRNIKMALLEAENAPDPGTTDEESPLFQIAENTFQKARAAATAPRSAFQKEIFYIQAILRSGNLNAINQSGLSLIDDFASLTIGDGQTILEDRPEIRQLAKAQKRPLPEIIKLAKTLYPDRKRHYLAAVQFAIFSRMKISEGANVSPLVLLYLAEKLADRIADTNDPFSEDQLVIGGNVIIPGVAKDSSIDFNQVTVGGKPILNLFPEEKDINSAILKTAVRNRMLHSLLGLITDSVKFTEGDDIEVIYSDFINDNIGIALEGVSGDYKNRVEEYAAIFSRRHYLKDRALVEQKLWDWRYARFVGLVARLGTKEQTPRIWEELDELCGRILKNSPKELKGKTLEERIFAVLQKRISSRVKKAGLLSEIITGLSEGSFSVQFFINRKKDWNDYLSMTHSDIVQNRFYETHGAIVGGLLGHKVTNRTFKSMGFALTPKAQTLTKLTHGFYKADDKYYHIRRIGEKTVVSECTPDFVTAKINQQIEKGSAYGKLIVELIGKKVFVNEDLAILERQKNSMDVIEKVSTQIQKVLQDWSEPQDGTDPYNHKLFGQVYMESSDGKIVSDNIFTDPEDAAVLEYLITSKSKALSVDAGTKQDAEEGETPVWISGNMRLTLTETKQDDTIRAFVSNFNSHPKNADKILHITTRMGISRKPIPASVETDSMAALSVDDGNNIVAEDSVNLQVGSVIEASIQGRIQQLYKSVSPYFKPAIVLKAVSDRSALHGILREMQQTGQRIWARPLDDPIAINNHEILFSSETLDIIRKNKVAILYHEIFGTDRPSLLQKQLTARVLSLASDFFKEQAFKTGFTTPSETSHYSEEAFRKFVDPNDPILISFNEKQFRGLYEFAVIQRLFDLRESLLDDFTIPRNQYGNPEAEGKTTLFNHALRENSIKASRVIDALQNGPETDENRRISESALLVFLNNINQDLTDVFMNDPRNPQIESYDAFAFRIGEDYSNFANSGQQYFVGFADVRGFAEVNHWHYEALMEELSYLLNEQPQTPARSEFSQNIKGDQDFTQAIQLYDSHMEEFLKKVDRIYKEKFRYDLMSDQLKRQVKEKIEMLLHARKYQLFQEALYLNGKTDRGPPSLKQALDTFKAQYDPSTGTIGEYFKALVESEELAYKKYVIYNDSLKEITDPNATGYTLIELFEANAFREGGDEIYFAGAILTEEVMEAFTEFQVNLTGKGQTTAHLRVLAEDPAVAVHGRNPVIAVFKALADTDGRLVQEAKKHEGIEGRSMVLKRSHYVFDPDGEQASKEEVLVRHINGSIRYKKVKTLQYSNGYKNIIAERLRAIGVNPGEAAGLAEIVVFADATGQNWVAREKLVDRLSGDSETSAFLRQIKAGLPSEDRIYTTLRDVILKELEQWDFLRSIPLKTLQDEEIKVSEYIDKAFYVIDKLAPFINRSIIQQMVLNLPDFVFSKTDKAASNHLRKRFFDTLIFHKKMNSHEVLKYYREILTAKETIETPTVSMEGLPLINQSPISWRGNSIEGKKIEQVKSEVKTQSASLGKIEGKEVWVDTALISRFEDFGYTSQDEFEAFLRTFLSEQFTHAPPIEDEIVIASLSSSEHLFEDHKENGFIGTNEQLFKPTISPALRLKLLQLGLRHELAHEAIGPLSGDALNQFEKEQLLEDVDYAKSLGITSQELFETGLFPWGSWLHILLMDSIKPSDIPPANWTAANVRPEVKSPVYETIDELLAHNQAKLLFPTERLPQIDSGIAQTTNASGIFLGFIEGITNPVIIKLFPIKRKSILSVDDTELQKAQTFSNLGVGPEFYGIVQTPIVEEDGKTRMATGFAMQPVAIDETATETEITAIKSPDFRKILTRLSRIGLTLGTPVKTVQGGRISIDAGNAMLMEPALYNRYLDSSKPAAGKGVLGFIARGVFGIANALQIPMTQRINGFIEDIVIPTIEEGLLLGLSFGNPLVYTGLRALFVGLHAVQDRASPEGKKRTLWEKIALPFFMSTVSLITLAFFPQMLPLAALAGLIAHIASNTYVTWRKSRLQKGIVGPSSWETEAKAIENIQGAIEEYRPDIFQRYEALSSLSPEQIEDLNNDIYAITQGHLQIWGLRSALSRKTCPYFNGSYIKALQLAFPGLDLTPLGFQLDFKTLEKGIESVRFILDRERPDIAEQYSRISELNSDEIDQLRNSVYEISSAHLEVWGLSNAKKKKSAPYFNGSYITVLQIAFPDLNLNSLGFKLDWSSREQAAASIKYVLKREASSIIERYSKLSSLSPAQRIDLKNDIYNIKQSHFRVWGLGGVKAVPYFNGSYVSALGLIFSDPLLDFSEKEMKKHRLVQLERKYSWKNGLQEAIGNVRDAIEENRPDLINRYNQFATLNAKEITALKDDIYRLTGGHLNLWGVRSALSTETAPYWEGSYASALSSVFPALKLNPLGFQLDWTTPEKSIESVSYVFNNNIPEIMAEYARRHSLTPSELERLRNKIYKITSADFSIWKLSGAINANSCPYFNGSYINAIQAIFSDLTLDPLGFNLNWSTPKQGVASVQYIFEREIPSIMEKYKNLDSLEPEEIDLLKNKIYAITSKHFRVWKIAAASNQKTAPYFKGSYINTVMSVFNDPRLGLETEGFNNLQKASKSKGVPGSNFDLTREGVASGRQSKIASDQSIAQFFNDNDSQGIQPLIEGLSLEIVGEIDPTSAENIKNQLISFLNNEKHKGLLEQFKNYSNGTRLAVLSGLVALAKETGKGASYAHYGEAVGSTIFSGSKLLSKLLETGHWPSLETYLKLELERRRYRAENPEQPDSRGSYEVMQAAGITKNERDQLKMVVAEAEAEELMDRYKHEDLTKTILQMATDLEREVQDRKSDICSVELGQMTGLVLDALGRLLGERMRKVDATDAEKVQSAVKRIGSEQDRIMAKEVSDALISRLLAESDNNAEVIGLNLLMNEVVIYDKSGNTRNISLSSEEARALNLMVGKLAGNHEWVFIDLKRNITHEQFKEFFAENIAALVGEKDIPSNSWLDSISLNDQDVLLLSKGKSGLNNLIQSLDYFQSNPAGLEKDMPFALTNAKHLLKLQEQECIEFLQSNANRLAISEEDLDAFELILPNNLLAKLRSNWKRWRNVPKDQKVAVMLLDTVATKIPEQLMEGMEHVCVIPVKINPVQ
ncbi:MAG: hypothetical protein P9M03_13080, partial [Candidatus Theseobacter exili]|nr:hypothetical protein [Candidatus Theseobacter exili]